MRIRQIELFLRVCELGSISRAAEQLHIAQPALGLQIRNLEQIFGAELVTRHSRGVRPTQAGELVLEMAHDILARVAQTRADVRATAPAKPRTVVIGLSPSMAGMLASRILAEGAQCLPGVTLRLVEELSHILVEWAETERLDLALAYNVPETTRLHCAAILREELFLVTAAPGPAGPVRLADVLASPLALPGESDSVRRTVDAAAASLDLPLDIRIRIAVDDGDQAGGGGRTRGHRPALGHRPARDRGRRTGRPPDRGSGAVAYACTSCNCRTGRSRRSRRCWPAWRWAS